MAIDRALLHQAAAALRAGTPLSDDAREYVSHVLAMVHQLAFDGYDVEVIYLDRQRKSGERIRSAMNDMALLQIAHQRGRGMAEAWAVVRAKREKKHKVPALVEYCMAVEKVRQTRAQHMVSKAIGMSFESVKRIYADYKKHHKRG